MSFVFPPRLADLLDQAERRFSVEAPIAVSLVITDLDVGGAERALVALALGLDRTRWRPSVVCLAREGPLVAPLRSAGITVACLGVDARRPVRAIRDLSRALRAQRPALIQSFLWHANIAARLVRPLAGWPPVVGGLRVAERRANWHLRLDRLTMPLAVGSVCVSAGVQQFSVTAGRLDPRRLTVIPNGVDPAPFDRADGIDRRLLDVPETATLALYLGRLDEQKGLDILLRAASRVVSEQPDWHLILAGDGPIRADLHRQAAQQPELAGRVHWLGRRDDVPDLLRTADYLVLPSLWEGMPNVVLEAMAAGRAVVATRVEGTEELVLPGQTGWLVPPGSVDKLADALTAAAANPSRRAAFGQAGRIRIAAEFTPERVVAAYDRLWLRVLGGVAASLPTDQPLA